MLQVECGFPDNLDHLVRFGPTLNVLVGFDPRYRLDSTDPPELPITEHHALIDTGAQESCIDCDVAAALDLPVVDESLVSGVHGPASVNVHLAQIQIPTLKYTIYGQFCGVHLHAGGQPHSALLGRTFLRELTMVYHGKSGSVRIQRRL